MSEGPPDYPIASPAVFADDVLRWAAKKGWGEDFVVMTSGDKSITMKGLAEAIRTETPLGQEMMSVIRELRMRPSMREGPPLSQEQQTALLRTRMTEARRGLGEQGILPPD